jgi:hypothetical protein
MADFCLRGHPLTADNVLRNGRGLNGKGIRVCRTCRLAWARRRRAERAAARVCTECGAERKDPDRMMCEHCRELSAARGRARQRAA